MLFYQNYTDTAAQEDLDEQKAYNNITDVFIKPFIKKFLDDIQCVYIVISDRGQSLAFFNTIEECQYFARIHDLNYHMMN